MKKACFVQIIIIVTILTAVIVYIIKNHFKELIFEPGEKALSGVIMNEFDEKLAFVAENPEKDSFKVFFHKYLLYRIDKDKKNSSENIQNFLDSVGYVFRDSLIDSSELTEIKKIAWSIK